MEQYGLYIEINVVCITLLMLEICSAVRSIDKTASWKFFISSMMVIVAAFVGDMAWGMCMLWNLPTWLAKASCSLYFLALTMGSLFWFYYSEMQQKSWIVEHEWSKVLVSVPCTIVWILTLTGQIFYIDANGSYQRGNLHWLQQCVSYGYVLITCFRAFRKSVQKKYYSQKSEYVTLAVFCICPIVSAVFQLIFRGGTPVLCAGITISIVILYQSKQERLISKDALTGLNNRNQLIKYLDVALQKPDRPLGVMMMDANAFKSINDRYGHTEGDRALVRIADALRKAAPKNYLVARYGGDEFVVVGEAKCEEEIEKVRDDIYATLKKDNETGGTPWHAEISIGTILYRGGKCTIPDLIKLADDELYKVKRQYRTQRC